MKKYKSYKDLGIDLLTVMFITGTVGIALKFTYYFTYINSLTGNFVYFPPFPNFLDSIFLISSVLYLGLRVVKK